MRSRVLHSLPFALVAGLIGAIGCAQGTDLAGLGGSISGSGATHPSTSSGAGNGPSSSSGTGSTGGATSSSATTSSTSTTSTTSTSSGSCSASPCELTSPQCGCPAGEACTVSSFTIGCGLAGTDTVGAACSGQGSCAPGLICVGTATVGLCEKFCNVDADCTETGGICALQLSDGSGGALPGATLCGNQCDLTTSAGCTVPGSGCAVGQEQTGSMPWFTYCTATGTESQGQACDQTMSDCLPGYLCLSNGTSDVCLHYCDVNSPNCAGATSCGPLQDMSGNMIFVGSMELGVCE